ncbi:ubiquitin carboxyl-terminal hydrolase CYLD-like isoform X2 [Heliangelus exortis]|uniref:ubiquitin carboxyl-terminal hydrolase CYLD-like isoform X2 n=1 Tax=Heliangelus exortis TaxID=472823 RepID=UPI003A8F8951
MAEVGRDLRDHLLQPWAGTPLIQPRLLKASSNLVLNTSRAATTSLGNLLQSLTTLILKNFLRSSLNLFSFSLNPFPFVLLLNTLMKSPSPAFRDWKAALRFLQFCLFQAQQSQLFQPLLVAEVLQPLDHLCGFPLDSFQQICVLPMVGTPELDTVLEEEEGTTDIFREIPMDSVVKESLQSLFSPFESDVGLGHPNQLQQELSESTEECEGGNSSLEVNSMVQITLDKGNQVSGIIRWLGYLPQIKHKMAGVELDEDKGVTAGEWLGKYYFHCAPKRGLFVKLQSCQPDIRFQRVPDGHLGLVDYGEQEGLLQAPESFPPLRNEAAVQVLQGRMKGIQGHCNSCYIDVALFSLFSCTSVVDSMLFKPFPLCNRNVQSILRDEIVNPLRKNGFVRAGSVMHLREQLTEKGECSSFTNAEKDPEEFLNLIMHQILGIEPLLRLQSGGQKEQDCYCYQIFMDKQEDLVVPDVQQLVERSFLSSDLKLVEIPSCFIIQMPRFGKEYKMFSKIIPSLELDITDLLLDSPRECCVCGDVASLECSQCFRDKVFAATGLKQFCSSCSRQVHSHHCRRSHNPTKLHIPEDFHTRSPPGSQRVPREKMELFAVLCIETSHYVSFVRYGPGKEHWMFFDSMADRHGDENGFNIPMVTLCPEVAKYLDLPLSVLALEQPRDMDGVAKRLFCDAYMYLYQSKKMALYK